ncbi:hypothetical protein HFO56_00245 [Rhizobium laguerreae]|uniref:hypothetical protein n=1 Tax=Rhizobium laguerreae TaxID=1076926 RepID=UPI001C903406|nr:hypothetical protein [Rhizobium laguerreae]MBY3150858.1 hypothetical protein [Rhizobium laguerreae]
MIKRRLFLAAPLAAIAVTYAVQSNRHPSPSQQGVRTNGAINPEAEVTKILKETVSPLVRREQTKDFLAFAKRELAGVFSPETPVEEFRRQICTAFIINSNLVEIGYDMTKYEFIEYGGACSPFHFV